MKFRHSTSDPRVIRIRRTIEDAVSSLAGTRPLEAITVRDICLRSGVGRQTFFRHFPSLQAALATLHGHGHVDGHVDRSGVGRG